MKYQAILEEKKTRTFLVSLEISFSGDLSTEDLFYTLEFNHSKTIEKWKEKGYDPVIVVKKVE